MPIMVAAVEDNVELMDAVIGEAVAKEATPLDVQTTPRQRCYTC